MCLLTSFLLQIHLCSVCFLVSSQPNVINNEFQNLIILIKTSHRGRRGKVGLESAVLGLGPVADAVPSTKEVNREYLHCVLFISTFGISLASEILELLRFQAPKNQTKGRKLRLASVAEGCGNLLLARG